MNLHVSTLLRRLRRQLRRNVVIDEISEELRSHVEQRASGLERQGFSREDAERQARLRFGNLARLQDEGYDIRGGGWLETVWQDVRYAVRLLRRQPAFTTVAIGTFAIGMGATAALFSVMDAALLRPLPFPKPAQLVTVAARVPPQGGRRPASGASLIDARQWRSLPFVSDIALYSPAPFVGRDTPERLSGLSVTEGYFEMFGVAPAVGRTFSEDMTASGAPQVAMLGYSYWQRRFAGDPAVVGRAVRIGRDAVTVIGVVPQGFERSIDIWLPIRNPANLRGFTESYARLRDGISLDVAQREWTAALQQGTPWPAGTTVQLTPLLEDVSRGSRRTLNTLAGGVGLILLIACVNVGGLLLARGSTRGPELAVRASIGAGRGRLVRQLLTESAVLATAGTAGGIFLAWLFLDSVVALVPLELPDSSIPTLNWMVIGLTSATAVATTLIFGLVPARRLSRAAVWSLGGGTRHGSEPLTRRTGQILIAVEFALAVVLLAGAGLLLRSLDRLLAVDLGFDPESVLVVRAAPADPSPESRRAFYSNLLDATRRLPGVIAVGATDAVPLAPRGSSTMFSAQGRPPQMFDTQLVSVGYFEALGMAARAGRLFRQGDEDTERVVLDDMAASLLFPDGNALRGTVTWSKRNYEVVGVVGHVKRRGALREVERGNVYQPIPANHSGVLDVVLRPTPGVLATAVVHKVVMSVDTSVVVDRIGSGADLLSENVVTPRRRTILLSILAGLGLLLTLVGIASVTAYAVARRTREIGVRIAFGETPRSVVSNMVRDAIWPMAFGLAAGLGASLYATKLLATFLFETQPNDALSFAGAATLILITSVIAAWLPARRAASVDPVQALRSE